MDLNSDFLTYIIVYLFWHHNRKARNGQERGVRFERARNCSNWYSERIVNSLSEIFYWLFEFLTLIFQHGMIIVNILALEECEC
jgi:hypothetical protein